MRDLGIRKNSINIISTVRECNNSTGKKESTLGYSNLDDLVICTQFSSKDKFDHLNKANIKYELGLKISLIEIDDDEKIIEIIEQEDKEKLKEGLLKEYIATKYERNREARRKCLEYYHNQAICQICGFNFEKVYGKRENGKPYIEIHHIEPIAEKTKKEGYHTINYSTDLIPLCSNCHRMIHYLKRETLTPSELKDLYNKNKS